MAHNVVADKNQGFVEIEAVIDERHSLESVTGNIMGRTICALGDAAAMPVRSFVKHFRDEFAHHIEHKRCVVPEYL